MTISRTELNSSINELGTKSKELEEKTKEYLGHFSPFQVGDQVILIESLVAASDDPESDKLLRVLHREISRIFYERFDTNNEHGIRYEFTVPSIPYYENDGDKITYVSPPKRTEILLFGQDYIKILLASEFVDQYVDGEIPTAESVAAEMEAELESKEDLEAEEAAA